MPTGQGNEWPEPGEVPSESRAWAAAAHLLPFISLAIIGPLFVWLIKRDEDPFVADHGREALNFQLSMLIYAIVSVIFVMSSIVLGLFFLGFLLIFALGIFAFVMMIIGGVKAANGETYRYPLTMRMVT